MLAQPSRRSAAEAQGLRPAQKIKLRDHCNRPAGTPGLDCGPAASGREPPPPPSHGGPGGAARPVRRPQGLLQQHHKTAPGPPHPFCHWEAVARWPHTTAPSTRRLPNRRNARACSQRRQRRRAARSKTPAPPASRLVFRSDTPGPRSAKNASAARAAGISTAGVHRRRITAGQVAEPCGLSLTWDRRRPTCGPLCKRTE